MDKVYVFLLILLAALVSSCGITTTMDTITNS